MQLNAPSGINQPPLPTGAANPAGQAALIGQDNKAKSEKETLSHLKRRRFESNTKDRQWLAIWSAIVSTLWLSSVVAILIKNNHGIGLSDTVLVTLLSTTTINVLGIIFIVLRGHFNSEDPE